MDNQQTEIQATLQDGKALITSYADKTDTLAGAGVYAVAETILPADFRADFWAKKYTYDAARQTVALSGVARPVEAAVPQNGMAADLKAQVLDMFYPVGSIHMTTATYNPGTRWGGTWAQTAQGRVLVGVNTGDADFNATKKTGGAKTVSHAHTLTMASGGSGTSGSTVITVAQLPAHEHPFQITTDNAVTWKTAAMGRDGPSTNDAYIAVGNAVQNFALYRYRAAPTGSNAGHTHTTPAHTHTGTIASTVISVLQPYYTCYIWERTA